VTGTTIELPPAQICFEGDDFINIRDHMSCLDAKLKF